MRKIKGISKQLNWIRINPIHLFLFFSLSLSLPPSALKMPKELHQKPLPLPCSSALKKPKEGQLFLYQSAPLVAGFIIWKTIAVIAPVTLQLIIYHNLLKYQGQFLHKIT
ncbi:hypothetical protein I3843_Q029000 [Carya illinoinensis]|nr:hypothetical protein I3843_Q029000 [Carya illinoinensis]